MILDYLFYNQNICLVCKQAYTDNYICQDCLSRLDFIDGDFDLQEGRVRYPLFYNNYLKELITRYKFYGHTYLMKVFALILYQYFIEHEDQLRCDYIAFVAMDAKSKFKRGYNQVELLARQLSVYTGIAVVDCLAKVVKTKEQNKLNTYDRKDNLKKSYKAVEGLDLDGRRILMLDDIVTTGNTLRVVRDALLENYRVKINFLTITSSRHG